MQIMPSYSESIDNPYLGYDSGSQSESSTSFADEMVRQQEARDAVAASEALSVEMALESATSSEPLEQAPYSLSSSDGITYTSEEVLFTKQELEDIHRQLQDNGAPAESLEELKKLAEQPNGATLHQVLSSFYNVRQYENLSQADLDTLKGIANKIDPSGKLAVELLTQANGANGKDGEKFLNTLISSMDMLSGGRITLDKNEMGVIAKVAGLSEQGTKNLLGGFGPYDSVQLNKGELNNILSPAMHEFATEQKDLAALDKALDKVLGPILSEARSRMEKEAQAYALSLRSVEQSKVMIEKTVMETVNQNLEKTRAAQNGAVGAKDNMQHINTDPNNTGQTHNLQLANQKLADKELDTHGDVKDDNKGKQDNHLNNMLNKAEVRTMSSNTSNNINTPVLGFGAMAQHAVATEVTTPQGQPASMLSQQAASQIEKAMLSAAADGTKRLDLQLHPAELGAVTITLTSRNGELNALIRSEKPETTELMHKQLDNIRAALEQQGVKVEKLEVQTQTPENNSQYDQWSGMQDHNARQEENSRRETLERLRNIGKARNDGTSSIEMTLEQHVQLDRHTAGSATQGLNLVA